MDEAVEDAATEPLWKVIRLSLPMKVIRLSLPISDRKTLLAIAIGLATVTAGTTYVLVKYREKRNKSPEQSSTEDSEELELDRTPSSTSSLDDVSLISSSAVDNKFIYSADSSAVSELSAYSTKSKSSSDTERTKASPRKEDQTKKTPSEIPQEGYLIKKTPSKIEIAKTQEQDSESDEKRERSTLDAKDILPSISLEDRDEGPPLSRQVDDERSSISVSIGSLRAPVVEIRRAQSTPDELITEKVELREGSTEKVKDVAKQPKSEPLPERENLASKVLSQIKAQYQSKVGTERGRKSKNTSKKVSPSKQLKHWRTVNLKPRKHSKASRHHKKHKSKTKRRGSKTKRKEKSKGKRKK